MIQVDYRLGGAPRYYIGAEKDRLMLVPDEVRKCVAFVLYQDKAGLRLAGTAFFFSLPMEGLEHQFIYLVTAKHIVDKIRRESTDQKVYIRVNLKGKPATLVEAPLDYWKFHPRDSTVDVAILGWAPPTDVVDYLHIPITMAVTDDIIKEERIGVGDEVCFPGLFINHYGGERNLPIIRIGNIALMSGERVLTKDFGLVDAYLVEARSIGGLSGSPVFVNLAGIRPQAIGEPSKIKGSTFYLLGLMHGHWDMPALEADIATEDVLTSEQVNMGIAIVVPASKVLEVINQEELMGQRREAEKATRKKMAPTPDSAQAELTEEEFKETLKKVSRPEEAPPDEGTSET